MKQLVSNYSQFIIATHSPILLAYPGATIYQIDTNGISQIAYEKTEVYTVTKAFLENRERMIHELFRE